MNRRDVLKMAGGIAGSAFLQRAGFATQPAAVRPNFVFILADDLGWTDLGCFGSDLHKTPHLDRLAAQGMRFTSAYAAGPVCSPTRASIMTGKSPARLHITIWYEGTKRPTSPRTKLLPPEAVADMPLEEVTIAEVLKQAGYFTAHVGKWHLGSAAYYPETQGFDVNIGGTFWGAPATFFYPYSGLVSNKEFRYVPHLEWGKPGEYLTDRLTDEALKILDRVKDQPFFLHLCHHAVHTPIEAKAEAVERYKAKIKSDMHHKNETYAAMVESLDESVGRVMAKLDELGVADRTIVVFFSDNGGYINEYQKRPVTDNTPLRSGKGSLYEGGIRVPMIVRWPARIKPGGECAQPVSSIDFYPTFLEAAGLTGDPQHNAGVDGVSLMPLLENPNAVLPRDTLYWHYPHYYTTTTPASAIRQGDWKLIQYYEDNRVELYDLKNDLGEKNDLAAKMPERAADLRDRLRQWLQSVHAQFPEPNPNAAPAPKKKTGKK
ncbi:MAG: sulfatase [Candidatus Sumerlaeia bacterium]|nr:sulfatase [Candidatus Sumerlaeia bacterium]